MIDPIDVMLEGAMNVTYEEPDFIAKLNSKLGLVVAVADQRGKRGSVSFARGGPSGTVTPQPVLGDQSAVPSVRSSTIAERGSVISKQAIVDTMQIAAEASLDHSVVDQMNSDYNRTMSQHRALSRLFNKKSSQEITDGTSLIFRPGSCLV